MSREDLEAVCKILLANKVPLIQGKYYILGTKDGDVMIEKDGKIKDET
jgi:hypothetical protein